MTAENAGNNAKWCGQSIERVEDAALLTGRGRYIDDIGVRADTLHAAILRSPHAHAVIKSDRCERSAARARRRGGAHRRGGCEAVGAAGDGHSRADPVLADRGRAGALCRRAGRRGRRGRPLSRRGRAGADRGRVRAAAGGGRSGRGADVQGAAARRAEIEHRERARVPLRRSRSGLRQGRAPHRGRDQISAQLLHADRDLWRGGRIRPRRGQPTTCSPISWGRSRCTR